MTSLSGTTVQVRSTTNAPACDLRELGERQQGSPVGILDSFAEPEVVDEHGGVGELSAQRPDVLDVEMQPVKTHEPHRRTALASQLEHSFPRRVGHPLALGPQTRVKSHGAEHSLPFPLPVAILAAKEARELLDAAAPRGRVGETATHEPTRVRAHHF